MNDFNAFIDDLPLWSAPFGLKLLDVLKFKKDINVLDIGCGEGFPIIEIASRFGKTSRYFGLDTLAKPMERMVYKKKLYSLPTVYGVQGSAEVMPFKDSSFQLIVSNNGTNNVKDIKKTFKECRRVAGPGGQMVIAVNTEQTMKEFYEVFESVLREELLHKVVVKTRNQIKKKRLPQNELASLLEDAGFKVMQTIEDQFKMSFADGTALLDHYLIRTFFVNGWKELVDPDRRQAVFDHVEKELNRIALNKGFFALTIPFVILDCQALQD